jgi:hypothetical protein
MQEKYLRRVLGVDGETPGYTVTEVYKRNRLSVKAGKRKAKFKEKMDGRVQNTNGMLGRKGKEQGEKEERNTTREMGMPVKKWKD